jgi:hypothetical protein
MTKTKKIRGGAVSIDNILDIYSEDKTSNDFKNFIISMLISSLSSENKNSIESILLEVAENNNIDDIKFVSDFFSEYQNRAITDIEKLRNFFKKKTITNLSKDLLRKILDNIDADDEDGDNYYYNGIYNKLKLLNQTSSSGGGRMRIKKVIRKY